MVDNQCPVLVLVLECAFGGKESEQPGWSVAEVQDFHRLAFAEPECSRVQFMKRRSSHLGPASIEGPAEVKTREARDAVPLRAY